MQTQMNREPAITHHGPCFTPRRDADAGIDSESVVAAASSEAAAREHAYLRALNEPPSRIARIAPESILRQPNLPEDFAQQVAALDEKIYRKGIAIDRERVLAIGKKGFTALLSADHEGRQEQRVVSASCDLSDWGSVFMAFVHCGALDQMSVPKRKMHEQLHGVAGELDDVRTLSGFGDVWKVFSAQPRAVRAIQVFRRRFDSLVLGANLLERLSDDGRVRSRFFCGGSGRKLVLLNDWVKAPHVISLERQNRGVLFWLARESVPPPDIIELTREFYRVRAPTAEQAAFVRASLEGYCHGLSEWRLWEFVGRETQQPPDQFLLKQLHEQLKNRFKRVQIFQHELKQCFLRREGDHYKLDSRSYHQFLDATIAQVRDAVSAVAALAAEQDSPGIVMARFQNALWLEHEPKSAKTISEALNKAFSHRT
jgi:hypothetical protein